MENTNNKVKDWFNKNKVKLIAAGVLVGGAALGYRMLGDDIEVEKFFKSAAAGSYGFSVKEGGDHVILHLFSKDIRLGKFTICGKEMNYKLDQDAALHLAETIQKSLTAEATDGVDVVHF